MSMMRDLTQWWYVDRPRAKARKILKTTQRELAAAVAREAIVRALHDQCKTFTFADRLIKAREDVARLTKLKEQCEEYLTNQ